MEPSFSSADEPKYKSLSKRCKSVSITLKYSCIRRNLILCTRHYHFYPALTANAGRKHSREKAGKVGNWKGMFLPI